MIYNSFYIRSDNFSGLIELLKSLSDTALSEEQPSTELIERRHHIPGGKPDILYLYENKYGWCGVDHNAADPLHKWGAKLSKALNTEFLQVQTYLVEGCSHTSANNIESNYLLYYNHGKLYREIKVLTNEVFPQIDLGTKFEFELPHIHALKEFNKLNINRTPEMFEVYGYFTSNVLHEYCTKLRIDLEYANELNAVLLKNKVSTGNNA